MEKAMMKSRISQELAELHRRIAELERMESEGQRVNLMPVNREGHIVQNEIIQFFLGQELSKVS